MAEKRKDSKGRVLRKGEHERKDGRYHYVMGHSDASITMNVYNHSSFERTEKEMQRADNIINF